MNEVAYDLHMKMTSYVDPMWRFSICSTMKQNI